MMKKILRTFIASLLATLSSGIIRKYKPTVIMVTGSVGKTSTKDAIAAALSEMYFLRKSEKSHNTEFGVPFTIIGVENPWRNIFAWIRVFQEAFTLLLLPNHYPKMLVLEVGAGKPGDITDLLHMITPDIVVVTRLPEVPVHVEAYVSPQAVREEEFMPAYALAPAAPLIISADDLYARDMALRLPVRTITYGMNEDAQVHIEHPDFLIEDGRVRGMQAQVSVNGVNGVNGAPRTATGTVAVRGALGRQQLFAPVSALAVAVALSTSIDSALAGLSAYTPPPGRGRILDGVQGSIIVDESYNASPVAVVESLSTLRDITPTSRRIAVLGDMLELGRYSVSEHARIGELVAHCADLLITVGVRAQGIAHSAQEAGLNVKNIHICNTVQEASDILSKLAHPNDIFLVKGSQSVRLERVVKTLLKNPGDSVYLPRQDRQWKLIS
ncbi:MAG TPA: UDP-N-acetylmuramoyl-tripeptide--D-alanyl-D-alanine ligase [Candidatus Kaiserbacteria bacterium]|nr:UDP-N-acetylmuramoyl-tripeptide--D-alanyl-D-alanine ligase [Candidatus Kaiserbacteria bacterium]